MLIIIEIVKKYPFIHIHKQTAKTWVKFLFDYGVQIRRLYWVAWFKEWLAKGEKVFDDDGKATTSEDTKGHK